MSIKNRVLLSAMMFLQFFLWGSWYVTGANYVSTIGFKAADIGWMYSVGPIAGMIAPFFVGMIADRFFAAERVMGVLNLLAAGLMYAATRVMLSAHPDPGLINLLFFGHMLAYFPTLALSNTIAMKCMTNPQKEFPAIRVLGTIGWIVACNAVSLLGYDTSINMFYLTVGSGVLLGLFSFVLPHTPPTVSGPVRIGQIIGLDALVMLKKPSYLTFILASTLICIPLAFYYQIASRVVEMVGLPVGQTMSYGQMSEIFFMLIMPFFFVRLGVKWMLAAGMLAWVVRYSLFAFGAPHETQWMIIVGIAMHGICYDFFFVTGQIYTDQVAPPAIRAQAQGLLVLFTIGLGMAIGAQVAGAIEGRCTPAPSPGIIASKEAIHDLEQRVDVASGKEKESLAKQLDEAKTALTRTQLRSIDWKTLWGLPAIFAAVILVAFVAFFRAPRRQTA